MSEVLSGTYAPVDTPDHTRALSLQLKTRIQLAIGSITGSATADGLAVSAPLTGEARFDFRRRTATYELHFAGYRLIGVRSLRLRVPGLGPFEGSLSRPDGTVLGPVLLRFDARADLLSWLGSMSLFTYVKKPPSVSR